MTTSFLFPGQGAGTEPTFRLWYDHSRRVRRLVDQAAYHTGVPVERFFARGARALARTDLLQPVLTAVVLGIHEELVERGIRPDVVAGHSLGEIAACAAAGCIGPDDAVRLATVRGQVMARQAARYPGGMVAIGLSSREEAQEAVALASAHGIAALAGHNAPEQWVISGEKEAIRMLQRSFGARPLPVAGPWHSAVLSEVLEEFRAAARGAVIRWPEIPLVCNRTGKVVEQGDEIADLLAEQFTNPIEWTVTMATMSSLGVGEFVIPGPGKVLRGLVRQNIDGGVIAKTVELPEDLERLEAVVR